MTDGELMQEIQEAAAQGKTTLHEGVVCGTCDGDGYSHGIDADFKLHDVPCAKCHGTGKDNHGA